MISQRAAQLAALTNRRYRRLLRAFAQAGVAGGALALTACVLADTPVGAAPRGHAPPQAEATAEADLVRTLRAFAESGRFDRERAERMLGLRFAPPDQPVTSPLVFGLAATERSFVVPSCPGARSALRTAFTQYYSGDPIELTVAYVRSDAAAAEPADAVLHQEFGPPWSCSVVLQHAPPHSYLRVAAYVWRGADAMVTVRKEIAYRCAVLRVARHPPSQDPPVASRGLSCEQLPGFRAVPR